MTPVPHSTTTAQFVNRHGGNKPLPVTEAMQGVFSSAWVLTKDEVKLLRKHHAISLVVDTNVPGHPSVSIKVLPVELTKG